MDRQEIPPKRVPAENVEETSEQLHQCGGDQECHCEPLDNLLHRTKRRPAEAVRVDAPQLDEDQRIVAMPWHTCTPCVTRPHTGRAGNRSHAWYWK